MKAAASSCGMESGIFHSRFAGSSTSSAMAPQPVLARMRSPGFTLVTPSPTDFTTPESSPPGEKGRSGLNWYLSSMISTSGKLTPMALTEITAWPAFGSGFGTSSRTRVSGPPTALLNSAFMSALSPGPSLAGDFLRLRGRYPTRPGGGRRKPNGRLNALSSGGTARCRVRPWACPG